MKRYLYNYQTIVRFDEAVTNHSVLLRCLPVNAGHQTVEEEHLIFSPDFRLSRGKDAFGNRILYGGSREAHTSFVYVSAGIVTVEPYSVYGGTGVSPVYLLPTRLTSLAAETAAQILAEGQHRGDEICHRVHQAIEYIPQTTDVSTTAEEVAQTKRGVCQDFAHLMIALCRLSRLPARYACGFVEGTGETHAWVEVFDGYGWHGYDPANDVCIDYGYVKLSHGRDAADCSVSRGIYTGQTGERQHVSVTLLQI